MCMRVRRLTGVHASEARLTGVHASEARLTGVHASEVMVAYGGLSHARNTGGHMCSAAGNGLTRSCIIGITLSLLYTVISRKNFRQVPCIFYGGYRLWQS